MKKIVAFFVVFISISGYSQISLDFQLPTVFLINFKLNNSETKYIEYDIEKITASNQFSLYNPDGSLYKTIQMPQKPNPTAQCQIISNISQSLFDNDPSTIEYLVSYRWDSIPGWSWTLYSTEVVREDGTILLNEMNATCRWISPYSTAYSESIYSTESGTKLLLDYTFANSTYYQTKVFSLPGQIPTSLNDNVNVMNNAPFVYPNPNNGSFFIRLGSNEKYDNVIDLYSPTGKLIDTFKSNNRILHITNSELSNGTYFLTNRSAKSNSSFKMVIKK